MATETVECGSCSGTGQVWDYQNKVHKPCESCGGKGTRTVTKT
jgi:DnaJ-class molecular chaperone